MVLNTSMENIKINLVWDNWSDKGPLPNGLHPKYINEWETKVGYQNCIRCPRVVHPCRYMNV